MFIFDLELTHDVLTEYFALGELGKGSTKATNKVGRYESPKK